MTSASTLIRKAAKAKPAEAKRLRAQAAKLRREAREAKKPGPNLGIQANRPARGAIIGGDPNVKMPPPNHAKNALYVGREAANDGQDTTMRFEHSAEHGWRTPVPPEPLVHMIHAEGLLKQARRKDATAEQIHETLIQIGRGVQYKARAEADVRHIEALKQVHEANAINVVCAFVAAAEGWARSNGGPMPATAVIAGHTLARVVDALKNAGYSADGLKSMSRFAADARLTR